MTIKITRFHKYDTPPLYGFIDISVPLWGTILHIKGCKVFMKEGEPWISLPSKEYTNKEGETKYAPLISLENEEVYKKFMAGIKTAWKEFVAAEAAPPPPPPSDVPF